MAMDQQDEVIKRRGQRSGSSISTMAWTLLAPF
jgi:hypothetical protein